MEAHTPSGTIAVPPVPSAPRTERGPRGPRGLRIWRLTAVVSSALALLVNVWVAWGTSMVSFPYDEIDTLLVGRVALGMDVPRVAGAGYFPGWSIVLAPIWWFTSDAFTFYRAAMVVGLGLVALTIWPLARVAARFGLTNAQSVTVAAIVMALPSRAIQSGYLLSERLVFLLLALTVLAAFRLWERPTYLRAVLFAAGAAATMFTHARMLEVVGTAGVWLLCFLLRRARVAVVGLVVLAALSWGADRLARHLNELMLGHPFNQDSHLGKAFDTATPGLLFRTAFGEAWIQVVGSFGLVAVGVVAGLILGWRELRQRRVGPVWFILGTALGLYVLSAVVWASPYHLYTRSWRRLDTWIYGRYADPAVAFVTLIGLCAVVIGIKRAPLIWSWVLALGISLPTVFVVSRDAPIWAFVTPAHIPGMLPWAWALPREKFPHGLVPTFTNDNRFWLIATCTALIPLVALALSRVIGRAGARAYAVTILALAMALGGTIIANRPSDRARENSPVPPAASTLRGIVADHPGTTVAFTGHCPKRSSSQAATFRNLTMWWLLPTIVHNPWNGDEDIVVSCQKGDPSKVAGAVPLPERLFKTDGVIWIMPGPLQDELRASGQLPPG